MVIHMNKKEFDKYIKSLEDQIAALYTEIRDAESTFVKECKHPIKNITVKSHRIEDDYGRHVPEWNMYTYKCTRCDYSFTVDKKFTDEKLMRQKFNETKK